ELVDDPARIARLLLALVGKVNLPVDAIANARLGSFAKVNRQIMSRQQALDARETGDRPWQGEERKGVIDAAWIGPRRHQSGSQKALDFRSEQQPIAVGSCLTGPVQGTDAETISGQDEFLLAPVPQGQGKLAAELFQHAFAEVLVQVRDDLGIAMGSQDMAAACQASAGFRIVEQLAVEDNLNGLIFVADGLPAVMEADDAEPAGSETEAGTFEIAILIRPAMNQSIGHLAQPGRVHRLGRPQVHDARDTAHRILLP